MIWWILTVGVFAIYISELSDKNKKLQKRFTELDNRLSNVEEEIGMDSKYLQKISEEMEEEND